MSAITEYFQALERLKSNNPINVARETKITNDAVALEAGRKKGSIKKSRECFSELIEAISEAAKAQLKPVLSAREKTLKAKIKAENYRSLYEEALAREVMLIKRVYELEAEIARSTCNQQ